MNYMPNVWDVKRAISKVKYKVMNYSELQRATRLATNDEPWNLPNSELYRLAEATWTTNGLNDVLGVCIERLSPLTLQPPRAAALGLFASKPTLSWRSIYKTLGLLEFLTIRGSERVKAFLLLHRSFLAKFVDYTGRAAEEAKEESGASSLTTEDLSIRKKATRLLLLLDSALELTLEREKAQENFGKYKGFSNTDCPVIESASPLPLPAAPASHCESEAPQCTSKSPGKALHDKLEQLTSPSNSQKLEIEALIHFEEATQETASLSSTTHLHSNFSVAIEEAKLQLPTLCPTVSSVNPLANGRLSLQPAAPSFQAQTLRLSPPLSQQDSSSRESQMLLSLPGPKSPNWAIDLLTLVNGLHVKNEDQKYMQGKSLGDLKKA